MYSQAFAAAPKISKKVKEITEWHRPDFKTEATHVATSGYDQKGNLSYHYSKGTPTDKWNTYQYDKQGRLIKKKEFFEDVLHKTSITYKPGVAIKIYSFHDKTYRICDYTKAGKLVERKTFAKGGEIEKPGYILLKRNLFFYNKQDSLIAEQIQSYGFKGRRTGKVVHTEKVKHLYDPASQLRIQSVFLNHDGTKRMERFYTYNSMGSLKKIMDYYHMEKRVQSVSYLYKKKKIWQQITEKNDQKSVLVFVDGRPLRRRNYLGGKLIKIVDYGYQYY